MASPLKKQMLSQVKLSGAAFYDSFCNKEWEQKYPISPGRAGKEFRCNTCYAMSAVSARGARC